jgi:hypothetical protein
MRELIVLFALAALIAAQHLWDIYFVRPRKNRRWAGVWYAPDSHDLSSRVNCLNVASMETHVAARQKARPASAERMRG